jgi:predicted RNA-binding protein
VAIIPWVVELDDDEVVLADNFGDVRVVQGEHELLRF